jgi:hypothetical protein
MNDRERYLGFLYPYLGQGFEFDEIVQNGSPRHRLPPERLWVNMPLVLTLANRIRGEWVALGGHGLKVAAAYRPFGGASSSKHKINGALDLDILSIDKAMAEDWYRLVSKIWQTTPDMALGLYCPPDSLGGTRIHIDLRGRHVTWQHHRGVSIKSPLALRLGVDGLIA